jgi:hypothetical protein
MKFDKNKTFPYPVLRPYCDDYVDVEFQATVEFAIEVEKISAEISYALSSEDLKDQIQLGNAQYVSVVSCRDTYLRRVLISSESKISADFDVGSLKGEVRVDTYIVAAKDIPAFKSEDINAEFGQDTFSFTPGDVLAQDETQVFYIDRDLFKPVTSVFQLVASDNLSGGEWKVDFEEDNVQIEVSHRMKESVDNARNSKNNQVILLNSLYFSAVVQALQRLKDGGEDYEEKRWAKVFMGQLVNNGWDLDAHDAYVLAQRLMKYPLMLLDKYVFEGGDK